MHSNLVEAANRAEATALLIREGFRVYRPEADVDGEDLVLLTPTKGLLIAQLKGAPQVDLRRYGPPLKIWMLFPESARPTPGRKWYLVPHDILFDWAEKHHGHTPKWQNAWRWPHLSKELRLFLEPYIINSDGELSEPNRKRWADQYEGIYRP